MGGFVIWALVAAVIILLGIRAMFAKKPVGFWANVETKNVKDLAREIKNIKLIHDIIKMKRLTKNDFNDII